MKKSIAIISISLQCFWWCCPRCSAETAQELLKQAAAAAHKENDAEALRLYDKALKLDPKLYEAYLGRAHSEMEVRRFPQAMKDCNKAMQLQPADGRGNILLGDIYSEQNQWHKAIAEYAAGLSKRSSPYYTHHAHNHRAEAMLELNRPADAIKEVNEAIRIYPQAYKDYKLRGKAYKQLGKDELAAQDEVKSHELKNSGRRVRGDVESIFGQF